jgi:hypothetical protein
MSFLNPEGGEMLMSPTQDPSLASNAPAGLPTAINDGRPAPARESTRGDELVLLFWLTCFVLICVMGLLHLLSGW